MNSSYITSATNPEQLPDLGLPEVAFIGRSNVGKSTLLNLLTGQKNLARASREPGRTQMVNFFKWNEDLIFADLPGYGFSTATRKVKHSWLPLIAAYLLRPQLRALICLLDARRTANEEDLTLWRQLAEEHHRLVFVVTKSDKLNQSERFKAERDFTDLLKQNRLHDSDIFWTSSTKKTGVEELRRFLLQLIQTEV